MANKLTKPSKDKKRLIGFDQDSEIKLEKAENIAKNASKATKRTYAQFENSFVYLVRTASGLIDKFLFHQKFGKYAALLLSIVLYIAVNADGSSSSILASSSGAQLEKIPVQTIVNSEVYEISGIPETVTATVIGDASDIQLLKSQSSYKVTADLSGLTEGTHQVTLTPTDFSSRVTVTLNPSTVVVTIKKKTTAKFKITHEYINKNRMDSIYALDDNPTLDTTEVIVRASQDTIDSIAYVKVLIDVTGATQDFETTSPIVAYNQNGELVNIDIVPSTVTASVKVTTPQKEVPIKITPVGDLPDGLAIESISLDHSTVTVYAPNSVLSELDEIEIEIDATKITSNTNWTTAITVPSGVNSLSVTKVNIEVKVDTAVSRIIENVPIRYRNNSNGYKIETADKSTYQSVMVTGTQTNFDKITVDDIALYLDMAGLGVGNNQEVPVVIEGTNSMVTYSLSNGETTMTASILK